MAPLITLAIIMAVVAGAGIGAYLKVCHRIRRDDQVRGSLRDKDRDLFGVSSFGWDQPEQRHELPAAAGAGRRAGF